MSQLIITARKLYKEKDFSLCEKPSDYTQCLISTTVYEAWKIRQDYVKPGQAVDGTKALELTFRLSGGEDSDNNKTLFAQTLFSICCGIFQKENVLSCFVKGGIGWAKIKS